MAGGEHKGEIHRHSGWWIPAAFLLAILILSGLLLGWYLRPGLKPLSLTGQSHALALRVGAMSFTIPANYFESPATDTRVKAITLVALFPSWRGYADADAG